MMEKTEELLLLLDLASKLKYLQYEKLELLNLDKLRSEIEIRIEILRK